jgi:hypothetical protein
VTKSTKTATVLAFAAGLIVVGSYALRDPPRPGDPLDSRQDPTSACDFSYYGDYTKLQACVSANYPIGSDFSKLETVLLKENYSVLKIKKLNGNYRYNFLLGTMKLFTKQVLVDVDATKISHVTVSP